MSDAFWPAENVARLTRVMGYAESKGLKVAALAAPFGFANDALQANPNWAEAQRVVGSRFLVDAAGRQLKLLNGFAGLRNANFEQGQGDWFGLHDSGVGLDSLVVHGGNASALIRDAPGNARLRQKVSLVPWRQYHVRLFVKSQDFRGYSQLIVMDADDHHKNRLNADIKANGTQEWTQLDFAFDSQNSSSADLYFGVWGGCSGSLWFDDVQVAETALVYVARRPGTPITVYDPDHSGTVYREGADYNLIEDTRMNTTRTPFSDSYHAPTPITLPTGTRLKPGQVVAIDSYSVFPIPGLNGATMCLTEPAVFKWLRQNAEAIKSALARHSGLLLQYDEMRQMNSCASCRAKRMTAGELLAWNLGQTAKIYRDVMPSTPLYVWSDMFDPYHNAIDRYYLVEGDLAGSWRGLPADVTILNWNLGHLKQSLGWFAGLESAQPRQFRQIIAGFYGNGTGEATAASELAAADGIPGVQGLMYTTWTDDYSQLEPFAKTVQSNWSNYLSSLSKPRAKLSRQSAAAGLAALFVFLAGSVWARLRRLQRAGSL